MWQQYQQRTTTLQFVRVIHRFDIETLTDRSLTTRLDDPIVRMEDFWEPAVVPELAAYGAERLFRRVTTDHIAVGLCATAKPTFYQEEELALLRCAQLRGPRREAALRRHADRYAWIGNSYAESHVEPLSTFRRRLNDLLRRNVSYARARQELQRRAREVNVERKRCAALVKSDAKIARFGVMAAHCTWWQDQSKRDIFRYLPARDRLARECERRAGLPSGLYDVAFAWEVSPRPTRRLVQQLTQRRRFRHGVPHRAHSCGHWSKRPVDHSPVLGSAAKARGVNQCCKEFPPHQGCARTSCYRQ